MKNRNGRENICYGGMDVERSSTTSGRGQIYDLYVQSNVPYHPDPDDHHRCGTCGRKYTRAQGLKTNRTRTEHKDKDIDDIKITKTVMKRKAQQNLLSKVMWGSQVVNNG